MKRYKLISHLIKEKLKNKLGAEVGIWRGFTTEYLLSHHRKLTLICVDPYEFYEHYDTFHSLGKYNSQDKLDNLCAAVRNRLKKKFGERVRWIRKRSIEASKGVENGSLDWVFLDGNWGYRYVQEDIKAWLPKIRPGGIMIGHRIDSNKDGPNCVKRAVESVLKNYETMDGRWYKVCLRSI